MPRATPPPGIPVPSTGRLGSLLRVPIDYIFEVRDKYGALSKQLAPMSLPLSPSVYQQTRNPPTKVSYTLTGTHIDRNTQKDHSILLQGQSGNKVRVGYNRDGEVIFQSGRVIFEEFDVFLENYQEYVAEKPDSYLVFRSLNEGFSYKVELVSWNWSLDASKNKFSYEWSLQLKAYAEALPSPLLSIFSPVDLMAQELADAIGIASAGLAVADNAFNNLGGALNQLLEPVRALNALGQSLQALNNSASGLDLFLTKGILAELTRASDSLTKGLKELLNQPTDYSPSNTPGLAFQVAQLESARKRKAAIRGLEDSITTIATAYGFAGGDPLGIDTNRMPLSSAQERRFIRENSFLGDKQVEIRKATLHTMRAGEDLRSLALRVYGDAEQWVVIADFNDMRSADIKANGSKLKVGDQIYVPSLETAADFDASVNRNSDPYLVDLLLVDGDLDILDGDFRTVRGIENLQQAINTKTRTILGETVLYPSIGLPDVVGAPVTSRLIAYLSTIVFEQVSIDPRIQSLSDIEFLVEGDSIIARFQATPVTGTSFPMETIIRSA